MASGCIVGECPVCGEWIFEDEWCLAEDTLVHEDCKEQFFRDKYGLSEEQLQQLYGAQELKHDIEEIRKEFQHELKYFTQQINTLNKRLEGLERKEKSHV
jgi:trans-2-enoyl-CoA reductase